MNQLLANDWLNLSAVFVTKQKQWFAFQWKVKLVLPYLGLPQLGRHRLLRKLHSYLGATILPPGLLQPNPFAHSLQVGVCCSPPLYAYLQREVDNILGVSSYLPCRPANFLQTNKRRKPNTQR